MRHHSIYVVRYVSITLLDVARVSIFTGDPIQWKYFVKGVDTSIERKNSIIRLPIQTYTYIYIYIEIYIYTVEL